MLEFLNNLWNAKNAKPDYKTDILESEFGVLLQLFMFQSSSIELKLKLNIIIQHLQLASVIICKHHRDI